MTFSKVFERPSLLAIAVTAALASAPGHADDRISATASPDTANGGANFTADQRAAARSRMPLLELDQLPLAVREQLGSDSDRIAPAAYGSGGHPYTTKRAAPARLARAMMKQQPFAPTGKLWMQWPDGLYVCTASVIDKGLIVTAAHCVIEFGTGAVPTSVWFEPARNGNSTPFGSFDVSNWIYLTAYANGTDVCDPQAPGVVCENDLAVATVEPNGNGQYIESVLGGSYGVQDGDFGYVNFYGEIAAQITQLGYPVSLDGGNRMIRTDSVGGQSTPNQVVIGSDQTGGSSGGPWLANFGISPQRSGNPVPTDSTSNQVMATTSWGYVDPGVDVQGASRFDNNTIFPAPGPSNIEGILNYVCTNYPTYCN